jgi:hypothetical protein
VEVDSFAQVTAEDVVGRNDMLFVDQTNPRFQGIGFWVIEPPGAQSPSPPTSRT